MSQEPQIYYYGTIDSTQETLKELMRQNPDLPSFTAVAANSQRKGRGRGVSTWQDVEGASALVSIFIRWNSPVRESFNVNRWVCAVLSEVLPSSVAFKWPNDLMVGHRKLGGLLIENHWGASGIKSSIVGLGVNIHNRHGFPVRAVSLSELADDAYLLETMGGLLSPSRFIVTVLDAMQANASLMTEERALHAKYKSLLWGQDQWEYYESHGERFRGKVLGTTPEGMLYLLLENGQRAIFKMDDIKWQDPLESKV